MAKTKYLTVRINDDIEMQLNELCNTFKLNKTQVIERLIYGEYIRSTKMGKLKIQEIMSSLTNLNEKLQRLNENVK